MNDEMPRHIYRDTYALCKEFVYLFNKVRFRFSTNKNARRISWWDGGMGSVNILTGLGTMTFTSCFFPASAPSAQKMIAGWEDKHRQVDSQLPIPSCQWLGYILRIKLAEPTVQS